MEYSIAYFICFIFKTTKSAYTAIAINQSKTLFTRNVCEPVCVNVNINFNIVLMTDIGNGFQTHSLRVRLHHH